MFGTPVALCNVCGRRTSCEIRRRWQPGRGLRRRYRYCCELDDRCEACAIRVLPGPGCPSCVPQAVRSPARYDDLVSAQPAEREDPLDPQRILDRLPEDERGSFLEQYQEAVENARDPVGWKQLQRVLRLWRFHADAAGEPGYREALDAARGPVSGGMPLEEAVRAYRLAS